MVQGTGITGGKVTFTNTESSQYISSILITASYAGRDVEIELRGTTSSMPYIYMTEGVMNHFGVEVTKSRKK